MPKSLACYYNHGNLKYIGALAAKYRSHKTMKTLFRPPGRFKIWTEGQLLLTEVTGPWNRELVDHWAKQALQLAGTFSPDRPYVAITTVFVSILCPADALERIKQAIDFSQHELPCIANIIVADASVEGRELVKETYARIGLPGFFEDLESAKNWAKQALQETPTPLIHA